MQSVDVLVVGGGPAGATAAWALRRRGADVLVWDRARFPRAKVCAGWITPQVVASLELDLADYAAGGRTVQPIRGFQVSRQGDREARVRYPDVVSYGIRRCEFDHYLLARSGARQRLGEPLRALERRDGCWVGGDAVRAPVVIGAGGHFCPVAQRLGARLGQGEAVVAAQEAEFMVRPPVASAYRVEADLPEVFFTRDLQGYGWVFRKGDHVNIGLGRQGNRGLSEHVTAFVAWLARRGTVPPALDGAMRGHPYLLYGQSRRPLGGAGALLVGDAAGLAYPRSGEGIRPAVESALLAARAVAAGQGRVDEAASAGYARAVATRFGRRQPAPGPLDRLPTGLLAPLAGRLFGMPWFARHVVLDQWFFHAGQAPLADDA